MEILPDGSGADKFKAILDSISEGRTYLVCEKHRYSPGPNNMPTSGCADCWRALYWTIYAQLGPERGAEWLDGVEAAVNHASEQIEKGTWDFEVTEHPQISIEPEEPAVELTDPS